MTDIIKDLAIIVVNLFDMMAGVYQPSDPAIDAYNRVAGEVGHEQPNNAFWRPQSKGPKPEQIADIDGLPEA